MASFGNGGLTLSRLIEAMYNVAQNSPTTQKLCAIWQKLPAEATHLITPMLLRRHVKASPALKYADDLLTSGVAQWKTVGNATYLEFRSWYIELVVRSHLNELGLSDQFTAPILAEDLIPLLLTFNQEAFQLIHDIESCARHLVSTYLLMHHVGDDHILKGHAKIRNERTGIFEDLYDRTLNWRNRTEKNGLMVRHNPLITYSTTRDLAVLIEEIGREVKIRDWIEIANSMQKLVVVRDAVMHNQLIEFDTLEQLYSLQAKIYRLLDSENS
jgi:hypothetical protein